MRAPGKKLLETTKGFILSLDEARNSTELCDSILEFTKQFGAEYLLAGTIPTNGTPSRIQKQSVLLERWPKDWMTHYFRSNYIFNDPTILNLHETYRPFFWNEIDHLIKENRKASLIMNEATEFGFRSGITVPLFTIDDELMGFALAGERLETREEVRNSILIIANYALARAIALREQQGQKEIKLTNREREALQWIASGRLRHEISDTMLISEHGVDKHLRSCREKLGAKTTAFAVAEALRRRIIT